MDRNHFNGLLKNGDFWNVLQNEDLSKVFHELEPFYKYSIEQIPSNVLSESIL